MTIVPRIVLGLVGIATMMVQIHAAALIPLPQHVEYREGVMALPETIRIHAGAGARDAAKLLQGELAEIAAPSHAVVAPGKARAHILLMLDPALLPQGEESYTLEISPERAVIRAPRHVGLVYGGQTLLQLLRHEGADWSLPCVTITDHPRFQWRGLLLDCSRTFQSPDYLKKTLDRMAFYKLNRLHLHLTDDQGWRIEIKKHPELTKKGAWFEKESGEPARHQGFYSQKEMKALVRYGEARGITIVPEIEMPGHSLAALACHPELSCAGGPFKILPNHQTTGIQRDIFCAGNEATYAFLEDVLDEVIEIFPSRYIHIGGDEAPKARWKACPKCQARIQAERLANETELQSYFTKRIEKIINARGRILMGWDEILEGGLAPNAAVMSWRGTQGGIAAARAGHPVVMTPTSHCYFDYTYERISTATAYSFEPIPTELSEAEGRLILGVQANFWTERNREPELADRQIFPRLAATAERGWSSREVRDYDDFARRLRAQRPALQRMEIHYMPGPPLDD